MGGSALHSDDRPEAATAPFVSVVVPHFSDLTSLAICLEHLGAQTYPRDRFEIVVADNASPQGAEGVEQVMAGRAKLVVVTERGAGLARNGGVHAATGEVLAFTDCDCQPEPDWLAAGVAALAKHEIVGGRVKVLVEDPVRMTAAEAFERVFAFDNQTYVTLKGFTVSANLFCSRALFDTVGGFGVGLSEDVDWCRRASAAGFGLGYAPDAVVGHPARRDWPELIRKARRINAETFALLAARPWGRAVWLARTCALPFSALIHTPKVLVSRQITRPADRLSALAILYRLRLWRVGDSLHLLLGGAAK